MFGGMSSKADRAHRSQMHILPIKVQVRQADGGTAMRVVDADVRRPKGKDRRKPQREEE